MCGIAGILSHDPLHVSRERLKKMTDAIAHRGPDGEGGWISSSGIAGLGHRRLSIIDLSPAAAQPMHYLGRYSIVHNGEIYNYSEIRDLLRSKGYAFSSRSDTEVILAAYDHFGTSCLRHFDGMFAFAIWDETEKTLFISRDRFGEKPLFFYQEGDQFLFASEMKALWAAGAKKEVNNKLIFNFLTLGYTQNPGNAFETFYKDIFKLPARSFLLFDMNKREWETSEYWNIEVPPRNGKGVSIPSLREGEIMSRFRELFTGSTDRRLRSDVQVGTSLSGGLDSSSIVATITGRKEVSSRLPTFSAVFPGFVKDESPYIELMTRHFPVDNHRTTPGPHELIRDWEKLVYHQEEPFLSSSIYAQFRVFGLAADHGVKVLLDGQGADELLAGYPKYYAWYRLEQNHLAGRLSRYAAMLLKKKRKAAQRRDQNLSPDFIAQSGTSYYDIPDPKGLNGILYYNMFLNGLEELLRYADRNSMAHGVEVRLPFLDHTLAEFVFSLPSSYKIHEGWTKWLLRKSVEDILPREIVWRKDKTGFEPPQQTWMEDPVLQEYVHEARRSLVQIGILRDTVLNKKIQPQDANAAENYDWKYLVTAACLH